MTFNELKLKVGEYFFCEDEGLLMIPLSQVCSTRLQLGDPIWLSIIGPSSSGKSQILRPLALTDTKFLHSLDDITENSFMSGVRVKKGEKDMSLLKRIGKLGILVISDLTIIFSKGSESKGSILSQFRMIHDGNYNKTTGTSSDIIHWEGSLGMLAGCTPAIYQFVEDMAVMGERMVYYCMHDYNMEKATRLALNRKIFGKEVDIKLSELYGEYIKSVVLFCKDKELPSLEGTPLFERVLNSAMFAATLRTPIQYDKYEKAVTHIPVSEAPTRVALELMNLAKGLMCMQYHDTNGESWELPENMIRHIEWCSYSLANPEKRACLRFLAELDFGVSARNQTVADKIGLNTTVIGRVLQNLGSIGILQRSGSDAGLSWTIRDKKVWEEVRKLENIETVSILDIEREISVDEEEEVAAQTQAAFDQF
jgi:hypothetical protein